ncbi:Cullin-domain-containing protein [Thozetella sp. PMI_491]|nr:Cullin-domain-containing protein [Thozetella sp. PMI_491]
MIRDAFEGDDNLMHGLRDAFANFINSGDINSKWNTGTSKVGEMIAKYMDMLLRGGLKLLPPSLLSDHKDRAQAEKSGEASTSDEDAELDRQLDAAVALFRFIEGKDVFEAFYKKDLSRRLLMGRSASQDAEQRTISKLKSECGSAFTNNLEQMFKDFAMAKEHMDQYQVWRQGTGWEIPKMDFNATILTEASWPKYADVQVRVPAIIAEQIRQYEKYYLDRHSGRKLLWRHGLATANVSARFDRGRKELMVSAFQAIVLMLFNEEDGDNGNVVRSYKQLSEATGLVDAELQRTLQSLACGKLRVLTKHPKGRDVMPTDTFTVNKGFSDPKFRVKINQIQLKETPAENKETHERVAADRQFETQAAIVRILKARKTMPHAQLVAEVIDQTKKRGALDPKDIKANLEKLIDKDYIERDDTSYSYVA